MNTRPSVSEDELHRWLDGVLEPARDTELRAYLAAHPEEAHRFDAYRRIDAALHGAFDAVLDEPLPAELRRAARPPRRRWPLRVAAACAWLAIGGVLGWMVKPSPLAIPGDDWHTVARSATRAHAVYAVEVRHPVEVGADQEAHLSAWLSKRLGTPLRPPHLGNAGFSLVGGRLLPGDSGPAAQFMYQDESGRRLTLYVHRDIADSGVTAFRYYTEGDLGVFYWIDGKLGYALSGALAHDELLRLARVTYGELNP